MNTDSLQLSFPSLRGIISSEMKPLAISRALRLGNASSPLTNALPRLVAAGHSLAVIAFCLGFKAEWVMEQVVALGLPTPSGQPVRRSGSKTPWTPIEMQQLIALWNTNLYATCIGLRIGRSAASIRYKAKWLGLAARERSSLLSEAIAPVLVARKNGKPWTIDEGRQLGDRYLRGLRNELIAIHFERTCGSINSRAGHLGLEGRHGETLISTYDPKGPYLKKFQGQDWQYMQCGTDPNHWQWVVVKEDGKSVPYNRTAPATRKLKSYRELVSSSL